MEKNKIESVVLVNDTFAPLLDGVAATVSNYQRVLFEDYQINAPVLTPRQKNADYQKFKYPVYPYNSVDTEKSVGYRGGVPFSPKIVKKLKENPPKLIHCHCPITAMTFSMALRKIYKAPIILTYHTKFDIDYKKRIKNRLFRWATMQYTKAQLNSADEVWAVSKATGENLKAMGYKGKYRVMENGIDMPNVCQSKELVEKYTKEVDIQEDELVFLFIGRHLWYKGFKITLDALKKLKEDNVKFKFISIGDGPDEKDIKKYTTELGLDDRVRFLGAISDREILRAWYTRADLFILPSVYDCNPLVVLEAAANKTASVLIKNSDSSQGKTDRVNSFLIEENPESLYELLKELNEKKDFIKEVGSNASRDLYVSWEDSIKRAYERYGEVLKLWNEHKLKKHKTLYNFLMILWGGLMHFFSLFVSKKSLKTFDR